MVGVQLRRAPREKKGGNQVVYEPAKLYGQPDHVMTTRLGRTRATVKFKGEMSSNALCLDHHPQRSSLFQRYSQNVFGDTSRPGDNVRNKNSVQRKTVQVKLCSFGPPQQSPSKNISTSTPLRLQALHRCNSMVSHCAAPGYFSHMRVQSLLHHLQDSWSFSKLGNASSVT